MLKNTFCHIPGIGIKSEKKLWDIGFNDWDDFFRSGNVLLSSPKYEKIKCFIEESLQNLENNNPKYFESRLPSQLLWRMFPEFKEHVAYLDIETTGLYNFNEITTIALYDGNNIYYYINGQNLENFVDDILNYKLIVTYNGRCFDVPFIENYFKIRLNHAHIDLRYILKSLGFKGGLKGCETQIGIDRGELRGINGYFAVLLWQEYKIYGNQKALETLLAYNIEDVVNLETLMVMAYNMKLKDTPFLNSHKLWMPSSPVIPFRPHNQTIEKIRYERVPGYCESRNRVF